MKKWPYVVVFELLFLLVFATTHYGSSQVLPTTLKVSVIDNLGNFVEGAEVILYASEDDYNSDKNPIAGPLKTDKKGRVTFKGLGSQSYFVDAKYDDKSNMGEGVKTAVLKEGRINKVNTVIL
ncbi:MAG: carboxypeptidase regulatory-like domain-containing protein [Bacteroidota bacterium]